MSAPLPGTLREGGAPFAETRWSVILASGAAGEESRAALAQLCHDYWPPLYSFVRRRGHPPADAQDLVQGFFADFLERRAYVRTDPARGRFRSFLLASLKHFLADARDREQRVKRGGGFARGLVFLDDEMAAAEALCEREERERLAVGAPPDEEREFERRWATLLTARALEGLRAENAGVRAFAELEPFLRGGSGLPAQDEVAARLGIPVETLRSHLSRFRSRYRELLRAEVARTVAQPGDVDDELRHLRSVLVAMG